MCVDGVITKPMFEYAKFASASNGLPIVSVECCFYGACNGVEWKKKTNISLKFLYLFITSMLRKKINVSNGLNVTLSNIIDSYN